MIKTVEWTKDGVRMLDQRLLPSEETYLMLRSYDEVAEAIRKMVIRGAPAIGGGSSRDPHDERPVAQSRTQSWSWPT